MVQCRIALNAGRFGEWYIPETVLISAHLENGGLFDGNGDVVVVVDRGLFGGTLVENCNIAIVSKSTHTE